MERDCYYYSQVASSRSGQRDESTDRAVGVELELFVVGLPPVQNLECVALDDEVSVDLNISASWIELHEIFSVDSDRCKSSENFRECPSTT